MKSKFLYVFFVVAVLACCFTFVAAAGESDLDKDAILELDKVESYDECYASGDVDADGSIAAADARIILRVSVNLDKIDASAYAKADLDGDGKITAKDARLALRLAVGLEEIPKHHIEEIVVLPATCSTEGITVKMCTSCVKIYAAITVPASTEYHITRAWETVKKPTCVDKGLAQLKCINCGEVIKEEELSSTNSHSGEWVYPDGKSCLDPVVKNRTCTVCGNFEEKLENPPGTHNFYWETIIENTCTEDGLDVYKCKHCGLESKTQETDAHGHLYERSVVITEPTCTEPGVKGDKCVYCGDIINKSGIASPGHDYDNHHYKVTKEPTCAERGTADVICTSCGEAKVIELEKIPHTMTEDWSETLAATCTEPGSENGICRYCGPVVREIPAKGHTVTNWVNVDAPSCSKEGLKTGYCSVCGDEAAEEAIPKLPHKFDEKDENGNLIIYRTSGILCKEDGEGYVKCSVCGEKKFGIIKCVGKCVAGETKTYSEATCNENAKTIDVCRYCNEDMKNSVKTIYGTKLSHDYGEWTDTKLASCTENGSREQTCSLCGDVKTESIKAPGHTRGEWVVVNEATCSVKGKSTVSCTVCSTVLESAETDTLPHTEERTVIADSAEVNEDGHYVVKCKITCSVCDTVISEEETVTRLALNSEFAVEFSDDCDLEAGGTVSFTVSEPAEQMLVMISYGKDGSFDILTAEDGAYSFTIPDTISESDTITITVSKIN